MEAIAGTGIRAGCGSRAWGITRTGGGVGRSEKRLVAVGVRAASGEGSSSAVVEFETGQDEKAKWAGDDPLAKFVTGLIAIKPLYNVMKFGAKNVMVRTAEKNGIPWKEMVEEMKASDVFTEKDILENPTVIYPEYYTKPFHGYETGNLSWEAAFDVDPVTMVLWKRTYPQSESWQEAAELARGKWVDALQSHHAEFSSDLPVRDVLDMGCSTATSTRFLADRYPTAQVTGLDLSPYFLAVAQHREKQAAAMGASREKPIQFVHANAESTNLPSRSFDVVSIAYLIHECPRDATKNVLREAHRLLRPGGTVAITDQCPKSKVRKKLHPALWIMMKSTEPWLDEFYRLDLEAALQDCGFTNYRSILSDPRNFTCTATVVK